MSKLPILMYHNVCENDQHSHGLSISASRLESHLRYLRDNYYSSFHLSELENAHTIPEKSVVITFDDVTRNQLLYALPLLIEYNLKATFFIPFGYIGETDKWNEGGEKIMSMSELQSLDSRVELAFHSYAHKKYTTMSEDEIKEDFDKCLKIAKDNGLKMYNAVAYPFGNFPKAKAENAGFNTVLREKGIKMGLRIGNRINRFPFKNPFAIERIDIKGQDSLMKFKLKVRFGKLKLF